MIVEFIKDKKLPKLTMNTDGSYKLREFKCILCGNAADHTCLSCGKSVCMQCWNEKQSGCIKCFPQLTNVPYAPFQSNEYFH